MPVEQGAQTVALLQGLRAVIQAEDPAAIASSAILYARELVGASIGSLSLVSIDAGSDEVRFLDSRTHSLPAVQQPLPLLGLGEEACRCRHPLYHNDLSTSEWAGLDSRGWSGIDNVLFVPIVTRGRPIALLGLGNKAGGFTEADAALATAFGALIGTAIEKVKTLASLLKSDERFRAVAQTASDAIVCIDSTTNVVVWNAAAEQIFGYSAEEAVGKPLTGVPQGVREHLQGGLQQLLADGQIGVVKKALELTGVRKDGSEFPAELSYSAWSTSEGTYCTGIVRDITGRKRSEAIFETLSNSSPIGVFIVQDGKFCYVNPQFQKFTGYTEDELLGTSPLALVLPDDRELVTQNAVKMLKGERTAAYEYRVLSKTGGTKWIIETVSSVDYNGRRAAAGNFIDITERKELEQQLVYLASHDSLTGLPNRRSLEEAMSRVVARARRGTASALLFMDLDNFKHVNDSLGHAAGDRALIAVAGLLEKQLRTEDQLARMGGDEFAVLLESTKAEDAHSVAERLRHTVEHFDLTVRGHTFQVSLSIGMILIDGEQAPAMVLSRADAAMYKAKERGGNQVVVYQPESSLESDA